MAFHYIPSSEIPEFPSVINFDKGILKNATLMFTLTLRDDLDLCTTEKVLPQANTHVK